MQAEADARERHWQSQVSGLQSKVEKLESLLQREMGHHQIASPTPRPVYDISPVGPGGWLCTFHLCSFRVWTHVCLLGIQITNIITIMIIISTSIPALSMPQQCQSP